MTARKCSTRRLGVPHLSLAATILDFGKRGGRDVTLSEHCNVWLCRRLPKSLESYRCSGHIDLPPLLTDLRRELRLLLFRGSVRYEAVPEPVEAVCGHYVLSQLVEGFQELQVGDALIRSRYGSRLRKIEIRKGSSDIWRRVVVCRWGVLEHFLLRPLHI